MADAPAWLKSYYGNDFDFLSPVLVFEGKKVAVVKLCRPGGRGFSSVGFVLIQKGGSHAASTHVSLHEGMPTNEQIIEMKKRMEREDEK